LIDRFLPLLKEFFPGVFSFYYIHQILYLSALLCSSFFAFFQSFLKIFEVFPSTRISQGKISGFGPIVNVSQDAFSMPDSSSDGIVETELRFSQQVQFRLYISIQRLNKTRKLYGKKYGKIRVKERLYQPKSVTLSWP